MLNPQITMELVARCKTVASQFELFRMRSLAGLPGNPMDVEIRQFGAATAFIAHRAPTCRFANFVTGIELERIPEIVQFYRTSNASLHFELTPADLTPEIGSMLSKHSIYQYGFGSTLLRLPQSQQILSPEIQVRHVGPDMLDVFIETSSCGSNLEGELATMVKASQQSWLAIPHWHLYLATVDGVPAGASVLAIKDRIGVLSFASTTPAYRKRGCQTAMIRARLSAAAQLDCEFVMATAVYGATSFKNLQRLEFQVVYTQARWKE